MPASHSHATPQGTPCKPSGATAAVKIARRAARWPALALLAACPAALAAETAQRGPDVTLIEGEERTIYEYRQNGQLRLVKIVPRNGRPYFLAPLDPAQGFGDFDRAEFVVPRWEIVRF